MRKWYCSFEGCNRRKRPDNEFCTDHRSLTYCVVCNTVLGFQNKSGYCREHHKLNPEYKQKQATYQKARQQSRGGFQEQRRDPGQIVEFVLGDMPSENEYSIYSLAKEKEIFYIGSTKEPLNRIYSHLFNYGEDITMNIIQNVSAENVLYWECKMIVEHIEAGYDLVNTKTPQTRMVNGGDSTQ